MEKQKGTENQNWCEHFSGLRTGLIDVPIFSLEGKNWKVMVLDVKDLGKMMHTYLVYLQVGNRMPAELFSALM